MAKEVNEIVQRINSWYVGEDCAQIMIPYKNAITVLDRNGIVYHHKEGSKVFINNYVTDERRKQFPYHTIPTHHTKFAFHGMYHYANQLFDFEQPYIRINDGHLIESYVVKDKNEALSVNKVMPIHKSTSFKTREELEKLFEKPSGENESLYYLYVSGTMPANNEFNISTEKEIFDYIKGQLTKNVGDFRDYVKSHPESVVSSYLRKNDFFLDFVEHNVSTLDLNEYKLNLQLNDGATILLAKTNGVDISLQGVDVYFIAPDYYKVDTYDIPVTKYTLEQLKYLTPKIEKTKEPRITLKANPGITKEDIRREKQLILQRRKESK